MISQLTLGPRMAKCSSSIDDAVSYNLDGMGNAVTEDARDGQH